MLPLDQCVYTTVWELTGMKNMPAALVVVVGAVMGSDAHAVQIYWSDSFPETMKVYNPVDGVGALPGPIFSVEGIALDTKNGMIYWAGDQGIHRAFVDGSGNETILSPILNGPRDVALDVAGGHVYWIGGGIGRVSLDGSESQSLVDPLGIDRGEIALDTERGKIYWTNRGEEKVQRSNLDGSDVEDLWSVPEGVSSDLSDIAVDPLNLKLYWVDGGPNTVYRSDLDGSNVEIAFDQLPGIFSMAIDFEAEQLYWSNRVTIRRVNLDGSDPEVVVSEGIDFLRDIAIDPRPIPEPGSFVLALAATLLFTTRRRR
jgi:low density lipoprotein receptor-related protein 5/6